LEFELSEEGRRMKVVSSKRISASCSDNLKSKIQNPKWAWLVALIVAFALCGAVAAEAQQQAKVAKIGVLQFRSASEASPGREVLRREIRTRGYVDGKNIAFEHRSAEGKIDQLPAAAGELVRLKVDLLITASTPSALAAKNATKTIPIVFYDVTDPVGSGLIDSLARPGGNVTGVTSINAVLAGKRLELLKETVPKLSRVALLWNPQDPGSVQQWKESLFSARELGLQLHSLEVSSSDKYESAFKEAIKARSAALAVASSALFYINQKQIADLALKYRLPAIDTRPEFVEQGGLMSYGGDRTEPYRRVAVFVDKILKGTKPADIPVEQPMGFEFNINLKTAKALGLTIPPIVLMRATKVIR
jgi:putative ABC transport system substrate-binding protein